jgi:DNA adenine methylase
MTTSPVTPILMSISATVPYYGCDRMVLEYTDRWLTGTKWLGIPFAGALGIVGRSKIATILCNDKHRLSINLARCIASKPLKEKLARRLTKKLFHPDEIRQAQEALLNCELDDEPNVKAAEHYFVAQWMGRSGMAGTKYELSSGLSLRWASGGGDSNRRYRSAVDSLDAWHQALRTCTFSTVDFREFFEKCRDRPQHAIYCDPPFPAGGSKYLHTFTPKDHRQLHALVERFQQTRVLMRYYDHKLIRKLYADKEHWRWEFIKGRKSTNKDAPEVLITNILEGDRHRKPKKSV